MFADHYSHARLFWKSQDKHEQAHIASSFVFELSKVNLEQVPPRMVSNLRNVDEDLAKRVAAGLGIALPDKAPVGAGASRHPAVRCRREAGCRSDRVRRRIHTSRGQAVL